MGRVCRRAGRTTAAGSKSSHAVQFPLPDQNVAEALQRVTGVSIQRSRGEGDFVSIRGLGPNFVRGTINNRSLVSSTESRDATRSGGFDSSTGRETNFDLLPAEMIASIEVTKSPSASQVEGGIGGVVNIKTQRPLALGTTAVASAKGTYRDLAIRVLLDEAQKPSDIELEDPVWVDLISRLYGTRLKSLVQSQSGRQRTALRSLAMDVSGNGQH